MSTITKELVLAYILEGVSIGLLVASIGSIGSLINDSIDEENTKIRRLIQWVFTLLVALVSHVVAESLRHDRIVGLMKSLSSKLSFKRLGSRENLSGLNTPNRLFRKRDVLQPTIAPVKNFTRNN